MVFKRGRFVLVVMITLSQQAHVMMISVVQTCMVIGEEDTCIFLIHMIMMHTHHLKITIPIFLQRNAQWYPSCARG